MGGIGDVNTEKWSRVDMVRSMNEGGRGWPRGKSSIRLK